MIPGEIRTVAGDIEPIDGPPRREELAGTRATGRQKFKPDWRACAGNAVDGHVARDGGLIAVHGEAADDDLLGVGVVNLGSGEPMNER